MTTVTRSMATFLSLLCLLVRLERQALQSTILDSLSNIVYNSYTKVSRRLNPIILPKVSSRGLNDGFVHPGIHDADQGKRQQHHDEEVGNQYIVPTVVHPLPHLSGTNL